MTTLQKATAAANGYHGNAIRRCNEAKLIVEVLDTHESHDGIAKVRKALHKVQEAGVAAEEAFLKVTRDEEVETSKDRAETVSNTTAETSALCLRSISVAEGKLLGAAARAGQATAATAAVAPAAAPGRLV